MIISPQRSNLPTKTDFWPLPRHNNRYHILPLQKCLVSIYLGCSFEYYLTLTLCLQLPECEGCRCLPSSSSQYLVSRDPSSPLRCWVSSSSPLAPELAPTLRHAVLRAVSCEVLPGREGPLLFSSPSSSAVLCHSFSLKDSRARGHRRQYALLVVSRERHHLAAHWPLLQARLGEVVRGLQAKAEARYEQDVRVLSDLKEKCDYLRDSTPSSRRRVSSKPSRSLREVTQDPRVAETLHQDLVSVLALAERCLKEQVLSGQPLRSSVRGPGAAPLAVAKAVQEQVATAEWRALLYRLLSGRPVQVSSYSFSPLHSYSCSSSPR